MAIKTTTQALRRELCGWRHKRVPTAPTRELNTIKEPEVIDEVGKDHWARVKAMLGELYGQSPGPAIARLSIAPSIVTRGEVEMHGISYPRFAVRAHARDGGFVQVRRLALLLDLLPKPLRDGPRERVIEGKTFRNAQLASWGAWFLDEYRSPMADCVLPPPAALRSGYNFLRADLGNAYGEGRFVGVPYVQMMAHFGGAACAQACMLMSEMIVAHGPVDGAAPALVHGPAEMALSAKPRGDGWVALHGLDLGEVAAGLTASGYVAAQHFGTRYDAYEPSQFAARMAQYVDAQVPVILAVNNAALCAGCYGIASNGAAAAAPERNDHAVVLVGAAEDRRRLVINDPSFKPFQAVDPSALRAACAGPRYCAVYPPGVKLGLDEAIYSWPGRDAPARSLGVRELARAVQATPNERHTFERGASKRTDPGQFFLVKLTLEPNLRLLLPNGLELDRHFLELAGEPTLAADLSVAVPPWVAGHWVWLHFQDDPRRLSVWLAEAELTALRSDDFVPRARATQAIDAHLLVVLRSAARGQPWAQTFVNERWLPKELQRAADAGRARLAALRDPPTGEPGKRRESTFRYPSGVARPEVSLISSFSARGLRDAMSAWPVGCRHCELYAFMHHDAELFEDDARPSDPPLKWLATFGRDPDRRRRAARLARRVADLVAAPPHDDVRVRSIATFFPEITGNASAPVKRALATLVDLARELRALGHDVRTIELVGGNRIAGVNPYHGPGNEVVCFAKVRDPHAPKPSGGDAPRARHAVVDVLADVVRTTGLTPAEQLTFAVELEPGKVFAVHDLACLRAVVAAIDAHPLHAALRQIIGLNLDVGHFALAGIAPDELDDRLRAQVAHVHFSDHRIGHLADLRLGMGELGTRRGLAAFDPWLAFVRDLYKAGRGPGTLPLSRLVSLELEAVRGTSEVTASLATMKQWF